MIPWFPTELTPEEEQAVAEFMSRLGATSIGDRQLVSAEIVWWKAQLLARWEAERKVQRPLDMFEPLYFAAGLFAAGLLLVWSLPPIVRILTQFSN